MDHSTTTTDPIRTGSTTPEYYHETALSYGHALCECARGWWLRHDPVGADAPVVIADLDVATVRWPGEQADEVLFMLAGVGTGGREWISAGVDDVRDLQEMQ